MIINLETTLKSKHESQYKCKLDDVLSKLKVSSAVLLLGVLAGCSASKEPNYYSLTTHVIPSTSAQVRVIEVLPVGLADRLNRIPLVVQEQDGMSQVLNDERWTSTLSAELRDGLSAGLQQKLGAVDRYNSGMTGGKAAYRIAADFSRFDIVDRSAETTNSAVAQREIVVAVAWTIKYDDPNRPLSSIKTAQATQATGQLSCRMMFNQTVVSKNNQMVDAVNTSRQSLNQVVDAVAQSVLAVERRSQVSIAGVTCA